MPAIWRMSISGGGILLVLQYSDNFLISSTDDISTIGLFVNVHPALTWRKDFTQKVQQSISSVYSTLALGSSPAIQIGPNTVAYGKRGEKRELTSVLKIQCDKVHPQQPKDCSHYTS
jgi:hypothetical protein